MSAPDFLPATARTFAAGVRLTDETTGRSMLAADIVDGLSRALRFIGSLLVLFAMAYTALFVRGLPLVALAIVFAFIAVSIIMHDMLAEEAP